MDVCNHSAGCLRSSSSGMSFLKILMNALGADETMPWQSLKQLGSSAKKLPEHPDFRVWPHAKMLWSLDVRMISSCKRRNACLPSPYSISMCTPKSPNSEYARSSSRVVVGSAAQDIIWATLGRARSNPSSKTCSGIRVMRLEGPRALLCCQAIPTPD